MSKEVERRSIYSLLAKPIHRYQLVAGKYAGLALTLVVNVAIMAAALYAVLAYMAWGVPAGRAAGVGRARARSGAAEGDRAHPGRADDRHRDRAVLLDVLDADAVGGVHLRPVHRRPLQRRPAQLRAGRRFAGGRRAGARPVLGAAEPRAVRRQGAGRARAAGAARLHAAGPAVYAALYIAMLLVAVDGRSFRAATSR